MDYYQRKAKAYQDIDRMHREGISDKLIKYKITLVYGFPLKFVENRLDMLAEMEKEG